MKTYKWSAMAIAIAVSCVISSAAQTGNQAQRMSRSGGDITVTGCLRDGAAMSGGIAGTSTATTSTAGAPASTTAGSYVLTNAIAGTSSATASSEAATTTGTTATGTTGSHDSTGMTYVLDGDESDLKKHVGHRIEVTGVASKSGDKMTGSTSTSTTTGKDDGSMSGEHLRVSSIRMISADCSSDK
jgi:hypothetical protein